MVTALQRNRLRVDVGDRNTPPAFSDSEIDDLFLQASESGYTTDLGQAAFARLRAVERLLAGSANMTNYTANQSSESLSDMFAHLKDLRKIYDDDLAKIDTVVGTSVMWGAPRKKPTRLQEWPDA